MKKRQGLDCRKGLINTPTCLRREILTLGLKVREGQTYYHTTQDGEKDGKLLASLCFTTATASEKEQRF